MSVTNTQTEAQNDETSDSHKVIEQRNPTYSGGISHIRKGDANPYTKTEVLCGAELPSNVTLRCVSRSIETVDCDECVSLID